MEMSFQFLVSRFSAETGSFAKRETFLWFLVSRSSFRDRNRRSERGSFAKRETRNMKRVWAVD